MSVKRATMRSWVGDGRRRSRLRLTSRRGLELRPTRHAGRRQRSATPKARQSIDNRAGACLAERPKRRSQRDLGGCRRRRCPRRILAASVPLDQVVGRKALTPARGRADRLRSSSRSTAAAPAEVRVATPNSIDRAARLELVELVVRRSANAAVVYSIVFACLQRTSVRSSTCSALAQEPIGSDDLRGQERDRIARRDQSDIGREGPTRTKRSRSDNWAGGRA